jgi:hypothetical protein
MKKTASYGLVVVLVAGLAWVAASTQALSGGVQDPSGDAGGYKTDIRAVYHNNTASTITYYLQTFADFDDAGWVGGFVWDFNEDGTDDGSLQYGLEFGPSYQVYNAGATEVADRSSVRRAAVPAFLNPTGSTPSNTIEVVVSRADVQLAGLSSTDMSYDYFAYIGERDNPPLTDTTSKVSHDLTVTGTPPNTEITGAPPSKTKDSTPTFTFTSPDTAASFECSVDGGAFQLCQSPLTTTKLSRGAHTFTVRAFNAAGEDTTPAQAAFKVIKKHRR